MLTKVLKAEQKAEKRDQMSDSAQEHLRDKSKSSPAFQGCGGLGGRAPKSPVATGEIHKQEDGGAVVLLHSFISAGGGMKTVRWTVFIGGTLAGGSPNQKPATKSPGAERSEAHKPLPSGRGLGGGKPEGCGEPRSGAPQLGKGFGENPAGVVPNGLPTKERK